MLIQGKVRKMQVGDTVKQEFPNITIPDYYIFEVIDETLPDKYKHINFDGVGKSPYEAIQDTRQTLNENGLNAVLEVKIYEKV